MDFGLTREQIALREGLRRILASQPEGPWLWDALYERGVLGALLPSDAGGTDGSGSTVAIICEELGRACANVPVLDSVLVCARLLAQHPDFEDLGEALMTGRQRAAFAGLELETARYDWGSGVSVQGDRLTGQKLMVTGGDEADWIVVTTADGLYLVARDVPGMSRRKTMMLGGLTGADLVFRDSPAVRIGGVEDDLQTIALGVLGRCADALGAMGATMDLTIDMLRQRRGAATGSRFRADSHRLADMAIAIDHARSALVNFAIHADHPFAVQGWHAAAAKATISQAARQVADLAIAVHGVAALAEDGPIAPLLRRLWLDEMTFGERDHSVALMVQKLWSADQASRRG